MKAKFIKWKNVIDYCGQVHLKKKAFKQFFHRTKYTDWSNPQEIIDTFKNSDLITCKNGHPRIVFNIARNRFRLICGYSFRAKTVNLYIKFVGTHKEYDQIDACKVDMFKSK